MRHILFVALVLSSASFIPSAVARSPRADSIALEGARRPDVPRYAVGDVVDVLWGGSWWDGVVIDRRADLLKVHYEGWDASWDEWVETPRLRHRAASEPADKGLAPVVGQPVRVLWGGSWWDARVISVKLDRTLIGYDGYGPEWDEWVGPDRIRRR